MVFSRIKTNVGSHYDTSTGLFTCQYPGLYYFSINLYSKITTSCFIRKNGNHQLRIRSEASNAYIESSSSAVLQLSKGETIDVGNCSPLDSIDVLTSFTGFLLYPE